MMNLADHMGRTARNGLAAGLCFFLLASFSSIATAQPIDAPVAVIVQEVQEQPIADRIEALGTLRANESVVLTALVTETISGIHFEDGQQVEKGALLVEMTSAEERALLDEARSRLAEAKRQYDRVKSLEAGVSVAASLVDERRRDFESASAQLQAIESRLADRIIEAPFAGELGLRYVSVGALVRPGDPIITLDDTRTMKLDFTVPSTLLGALRIGDPVIAQASGLDGQEFRGTVASIDSRIDPVTRAITVRALLPNPDRILRPGLLMKVELLARERRSLVVPEEAVVSEGRQKFVYVLRNNGEIPKLEKREIQAGARRPGIVEVIDGLQPNAKVVVHGVLNAREGAAAKVIAVQQPNERVRDILARIGEGR